MPHNHPKPKKDWPDLIAKWAKVGGIIFAMFLGFAKGYSMLKSQVSLNEQTAYKAQRIEKYLSSKDPRYWKIVADQSDPNEHIKSTPDFEFDQPPK